MIVSSAFLCVVLFSVFVLINQIQPVNKNILPVMDGLVMEEEDDCPELVPIDTPPGPPAEQIPVTIISGYLGERLEGLEVVRDLTNRMKASRIEV